MPLKALIGCETQTAVEAQLLSAVQDAVHRLDLDELRRDMKAHIDQNQRDQKDR